MKKLLTLFLFVLALPALADDLTLEALQQFYLLPLPVNYVTYPLTTINMGSGNTVTNFPASYIEVYGFLNLVTNFASTAYGTGNTFTGQRSHAWGNSDADAGFNQVNITGDFVSATGPNQSWQAGYCCSSNFVTPMAGCGVAPNMELGYATNFEGSNFTLGAPYNFVMSMIPTMVLVVSNTSGSPIQPSCPSTWNGGRGSAGWGTLTNLGTFTITAIPGMGTNCIFYDLW